MLWATYAAVGGFAQIPIGALSDKLGARKLPIFVAGMVAAVSYSLYPLAESTITFVLLFAASGIGFFGGGTIAAAMVADITAGKGSTAGGFGIVRIWGSIGWIAALVCVTLFPEISRGQGLPYLIASLFLASAFSILIAHQLPLRAAAAASLSEARSLLFNSRLVLFLAAFLMYYMAQTSTMSFLSLYLKELGSGESLIAIAFAISAVVEIPFILAVGPMSDRIGRRPLLLVAFFALPFRLFAYSMVGNPASVLWIQLFHGVTFGVMVVVSLAYVADLSPPGLRATGQALLAITAAVASTLGLYIGGLVADAAGLPQMYIFLAAIALLGGVLFLIFGRESLARETRNQYYPS